MYEELLAKIYDLIPERREESQYYTAKILEQAADVIEELSVVVRAQKAVLDKFPRWIPITERLPKVYDEVLLQFQCNQAVGFWNGGCWCVHTGNDFYTEVAENEDQPTHWARKFPAPPKEEKDETNLEIAKRVIEKNFKKAAYGIYDCRNRTGDPMATIYNKVGLTIDICYNYEYFEVFGLSDEDFAELKRFYKSLNFQEEEEDE